MAGVDIRGALGDIQGQKLAGAHAAVSGHPCRERSRSTLCDDHKLHALPSAAVAVVGSFLADCTPAAAVVDRRTRCGAHTRHADFHHPWRVMSHSAHCDNHTGCWAVAAVAEAASDASPVAGDRVRCGMLGASVPGPERTQYDQQLRHTRSHLPIARIRWIVEVQSLLSMVRLLRLLPVCNSTETGPWVENGGPIRQHT